MSEITLAVPRKTLGKGFKRRSAKIILSNEARVLKCLRLEHRLSMRKAAELAGVSDSTVAHIETGRLNPPKGARLERLLRVYGGIKTKSFYERVRIFQSTPPTPHEELTELFNRANAEQIRIMLAVARGLLG
ncbi:MAG: helix-turn-helix domain-containing protein [Bdellovibrio sp.]|nr:helix-turn-helix domain-containing protein [Bdellovibrio sp.]